MFPCLNLNFRKQVAASQIDADRDGVVVPITMEEYCVKAKPPKSPQVSLTIYKGN